MQHMPITADSLTERLGEPVPDLYVLIAKNEVAGLEAKDIGKILGVGVDEIQDVMLTELYQSIRLIIGSESSQVKVDIEEGWDALERIYLSGLLKRAHHVNDPEFLLKAARVANMAQRRIAPKGAAVIDPGTAGARVQLTLTTRMVEKLGQSREREMTQTRQLSLMDGSATNPSFEELGKFLGDDLTAGALAPDLESRLQPATRNMDLDIDEDELVKHLLKEYRDGKR